MHYLCSYTITHIINHRSDFVYMVPPFLAYYGVVSKNRTLLVAAHDQIKLYRNYLRDSQANGLWKHVLLGTSGNDEGHWSTGV
jgi:rhamnogalacturonyl hydrolase YesR